MSEVDEIKTRLDIVDVLSEHLQLKPAGTNFKALCPFHSEKSPSFMVSRERQIWHCFGCGEGGDIFSFVQKIESLDFPEALKVLAAKAGVKLSRHDPQLSTLKHKLSDILLLAARFWRKILLESAQGEAARKYVRERGVTEELGEEFMLGFAPKAWETTFEFLKKRGFSDNDIFLAGLLVKKDQGPGFYDRFRGRLMFPIRDHHGSVVGFGGRILPEFDDGKMGKYINSPQTQMYNKSSVIYNLDQARSEIKKNDLAVVVEGYMDVIASWRAGVKNVVATSGTALTREQIALLSRSTKNLALAFDADAAGQTAALRGVDLILETDLNLKVITIPVGKDPDDCVRQDPAAWPQAVAAAVPFMEYLFDQTFKRYPVASAEGKKNIGRALLPFIAKLGNRIEQSHWLNELSSRLNVPMDMLKEALRRTSTRTASRTAPATQPLNQPAQKKSRRASLGELLVALALKYPQHLSMIIDHCAPEYIVEPDIQELYKNLIIFYTKYVNRADGEVIAIGPFLDYLTAVSPQNAAALSQRVDYLLFLAEKDFADYDSMRLKLEAENIIAYLRTFFLRDRLERIKSELGQAEKLNDRAHIELLSEEFGKVMNELNLLNAV